MLVRLSGENHEPFYRSDDSTYAAPGTPSARDLLAPPRRFERPTLAAGASRSFQSSKIRPVAASGAFSYGRRTGARSSAG